MPNRRVFSEESEIDVIADYVFGMSPKAISVARGVSEGAVRNVLIRNDIPTRSPEDAVRMKNPVRHTAFRRLGADRDADYFAGLLATDGCIDHPGNRSRIRISMKNEPSEFDLLSAFCRFVGSKADPKPSHYGQMVTVAVHSKALAKDLVDHGIGVRKTLTLFVSDALANSGSFWRGAIDGDGYVGIRKDRTPAVVLVSASPFFIGQFAGFVAKTSPRWRGKISSCTAKTTFGSVAPLYRVTALGRTAVALAERMYGEPGPRLKRKSDVVDRMSAA